MVLKIIIFGVIGSIILLISFAMLYLAFESLMLKYFGVDEEDNA